MIRNFALLALLLASSISAFANIGFCPPPATETACSTANGSGGHTIAVGTTSFGMEKIGAGTSNTPWYLLVSVPENTAGSAAKPIITSASFTQSGTTQDAGAFSQTTSRDIYQFASAFDNGFTGNGSMNAANMFCDGAAIPCASSNEISAFGSLPKFFQVFVYTFSPAIVGKTAYQFSVGGTGLIGGTYLAAIGDSGGEFSTPFTTTGLVSTKNHQSPVPEPVSVILLGTVAAGLLLRRKLQKI